MIDRNRVIKVASVEFNHVYIGTKSDAKKYYLKEALDIRNTDTTYAADIRRFTLEQLIWFVLGENNFTVRYRKNDIGLNGGLWCDYSFTYQDLLEQETKVGNDFHNNMTNPH